MHPESMRPSWISKSVGAVMSDVKLNRCLLESPAQFLQFFDGSLIAKGVGCSARVASDCQEAIGVNTALFVRCFIFRCASGRMEVPLSRPFSPARHTTEGTGVYIESSSRALR